MATTMHPAIQRSVKIAQRATTKAKAPTPKKAKKPGTAVAVHRPQEPKSLLQLASEIARDPKADVAKVKEVLLMIRDQERSVQERAFNSALYAVKEELPPILAASHNSHTKSNWARYEQVSRVADPIIRKHGFVLTFGMADSPIIDHYRVICDVAHRDGFIRRYHLDAPSDAKGPKDGGTKSPVQGVISTATYLQRNLKCMIFDIIIAGKDNDGNRQQAGADLRRIGPEELAKLREELKGADVTDEMFCETFKIAKIEELPLNKMETALARIAQRKAAMA